MRCYLTPKSAESTMPGVMTKLEEVDSLEGLVEVEVEEEDLLVPTEARKDFQVVVSSSALEEVEGVSRIRWISSAASLAAAVEEAEVVVEGVEVVEAEDGSSNSSTMLPRLISTQTPPTW